MENDEGRVPDDEPTGMVLPSTDVLTCIPACLKVKPNLELTSDGPNASPSSTLTDIVPLPKIMKPNRTTNNKEIAHSDLLTSTPKKIMLKEIRALRMIA
jgi:hypothetical protein